MENIIISLEAVTPMFCLIFIGVLVKKYKLMNETELKHLNGMVFKVFFSILMFHSIYTAKMTEAVRPSLMLFTICALALTIAYAYITVVSIEKDNHRRGAMIQAIFRSNFVILGIPIIANLFGPENIGVTTVMIAVVVPIYNIVSVFILEKFRGGKINLGKVVLGVMKNPMILGAEIAFLALLLNIHVPNVILKTTGQIAAATTPLALIILGASFRLSSSGEHIKDLSFCIVNRLLLVPLLCLTAAYFLGFRGIEFVTLIGIFCTPCAVASFTMAQQMDSDSELAGNCVIFTSALACLTIFGWILAAKHMAIF